MLKEIRDVQSFDKPSVSPRYLTHEDKHHDRYCGFRWRGVIFSIGLHPMVSLSALFEGL